MKVEQFYNKNQFVIKGNNGEIFFQSYDSMIARIDEKQKLTLGSDWNYSNTTRKHLYLFLSDYLYNNHIESRLMYCKNKSTEIQKMIDENIITLDLTL